MLANVTIAGAHVNKSTAIVNPLINVTNPRPQPQYRQQQQQQEQQNAYQNTMNIPPAMAIIMSDAAGAPDADIVDNTTLPIDADNVDDVAHTVDDKFSIISHNDTQSRVVLCTKNATSIVMTAGTDNYNHNNTVILAPSGRAVADVGGRATSETYAIAIIKPNTTILYKPDSVAVAGANGVAHAQADLDVWIT